MNLRSWRIGVVARAVVVGAIVVFMFAPTVIMGILSFSGEPFVSFPPGHWGLRQYREALLGDRWLPALGRSLVVAISASAIALVTGVGAVVALNRTRLRGRGVLQAVAVSPLLVPSLGFAIALYLVFADLHLLGTAKGLVLAHAVLGLPFVILVVGGAITRTPRDLEGVAMSLGASRRRALLDVTGRLLIPALVGALLLAFITSFDEVVVTSFVAGPGYETLPRAILADVRSGVDPAIAAVGMLLTAMSALLLIGLRLVRRWAP